MRVSVCTRCGIDATATCSIVDAEPSVPGFRHQPRELRLVQMNERGVIAALEIDVGRLLDAVVDDDVEIVALAECRHCAGCAVREQASDLLLVGHVDVAAAL